MCSYVYGAVFDALRKTGERLNCAFSSHAQ